MKPSVSRAFFYYGLPGAALLVALLFGGMEIRRFLLTSSWFAIQKVEVSTKGPANDQAVVRLAAIPPHANIFSLDLDDVKKRVERDPWIYSAAVSRSLPNRIKIFYKPQEPVAILSADALYYLNKDGTPFYRLQKSDSLAFPLLGAEGFTKDSDDARLKIREALDLLTQLRQSQLFSDADLGDLTVQFGNEEIDAPYALSLKFPPQKMQLKWKQTSRVYTLTVGSGNMSEQLGRWEAVLRYLGQQGKSPRKIRLELGKKVVVKLIR